MTESKYPEPTPLELETFVTDYQDAVRRVAHFEQGNTSIFEEEDVSQAVWLRIFQSPHWWIAKDKELRGDAEMSAGSRLKVMESYFRRTARAWCQEQTIEYEFNSGNVVYTGKQVKKALDSLDWVSADEVNTHSPSDAGEVKTFSDKFAEAVDLHILLQRLQPSERAALFKRHGLGEVLDKASHRQAAAKAYRSLVAWLSHGQTGRVELVSEEGEAVA